MKNKSKERKMRVEINNMKFIILQYYREHMRTYPTLMQMVKYINDSDNPDKAKKKYHKIEIAFILQQAVKRGMLFKEKIDKETYYKIRAEAMPSERLMMNKTDIWDGSLPKWEDKDEEEEIWQPDKPKKSKTYWDGSRENIWKAEITK